MGGRRACKRSVAASAQASPLIGPLPSPPLSRREGIRASGQEVLLHYGALLTASSLWRVIGHLTGARLALLDRHAQPNSHSLAPTTLLGCISRNRLGSCCVRTVSLSFSSHVPIRFQEAPSHMRELRLCPTLCFRPGLTKRTYTSYGLVPGACQSKKRSGNAPDINREYVPHES